MNSLILTRCSCKPGFAGSDCTQVTSAGFWTTLSPDFLSPNGSASHGSAVWRDTLHIIGGESYGQAELLNTYDFNGNVWEPVHTPPGSTNTPEPRFSASTVMYGDKIVMYGGVIKGKGVCDEVWAFDVSAKTWENITVKVEACNATFEMCGPLKSAGHTATLVPTWDDAKKTNSQKMYAIFGHSPIFGYLNTVQEYSFATREWKIVQTVGFPVKGGYGHSASYDTLSEKIYVYGGILSESESQQMISGRVYSYEPSTTTWTLLTGAASGRFLHTATFISPGLMMVFGGNTHNDTSHSFGAKCYSQDLLVYDVLCDSWHTQQMPADLRADLSRFGHSAEMFEKSLYIYGGFDGQMLSDIIKYTPGSCTVLIKAETCLNTRPGLKCVWDISHSRCVAVEHTNHDLLRLRHHDEFQLCPEQSRHVLTQQSLLDAQRCGELGDCQSCTSTSYGCVFCGLTGTCLKDKCRENHSDGSVFGLSHPIFKWERCPDDPAPVCAQLHGCHACLANAQCHWDYEQSKCRVMGNRTSEEALPCPTACSALTSCANCTTDECIWCQNEQRCVDKNAYTSSFPYGQCREWTTGVTKCRAAISGGKSQCGFFK